MEHSNDFKQKVGEMVVNSYFSRNFGTLSKTDFETRLFSMYVQERKSLNLECDDYTLSKELGISQSRIRGLKERAELRYPTRLDWENELIDAIGTAYYEPNDKVKCMIDDVNVMIEVRHFLESKGCFDEYTLNPKVMTLSPEAFLELSDKTVRISQIMSKETADRIRKKIAKLKIESSGLQKLLDDFTPAGLLKFVIENNSDTIAKGVSLLTEGFKGVSERLTKVLSIVKSR